MMKKGWKNLLAGIGVAAVGFTAYVLWEEHTLQTARAKREAAKRAEFIARRKAHAAQKTAAKTAAEVVAAASSEADACAAPHTEGEESAECTCEAPATSTPEFAASEQTNGGE